MHSNMETTNGCQSRITVAKMRSNSVQMLLVTLISDEMPGKCDELKRRYWTNGRCLRNWRQNLDLIIQKQIFVQDLFFHRRFELNRCQYKIGHCRFQTCTQS